MRTDYTLLTQDCFDKLITQLRDGQPIDRIITIINLLLSEEALSHKMYIGKVREELMMEEEEIEPLLYKLFQVITHDEAFFLHDVGKAEIFTLIHRVFRT